MNFNAAQSLPSAVLAGGTLGGTAAVTVTGAVDVTSTSFLFGSGVLTTQGVTSVSMAAGGGFLGISGGRSWVNEGTLTIGSDERILFGYTSGGLNTLTNAAGGTIVLASSNATPLDFYTGVASITNLGTLNQSAAGSHGISGSIAFNNGGTVNVNAGTLVIGGGGTDYRCVRDRRRRWAELLRWNAELRRRHGYHGPGSLTVSGGTVNASVPLTLAGATGVVISAGSLNFNAAQSLPSLVLAGGTLGGTAAVTVTGAVDVTSTSFLFGSGVLTTQGVTSVSMAAGGGFLGISGGKSWVNEGTLTIAQ